MMRKSRFVLRATQSHSRARNSSSTSRRQSGQIAVIIVLIMVVLLTIGLSLSFQSSKQVVLSLQEEESTRIFNAAEAGVEQALATDLNFQSEIYQPPASALPGSNATVEYAIKKERTLKTRLFQGLGAHIQLKDAAGNPTVNTITIDWSKEKDCAATAATSKPASIIVSIYSNDTSVSPANSGVRHLAFGGCSRNDDITVAPDAPNSTGFYKRATIAVNATDAFIRVLPMYNDTQISVNGSGGTGQLPVQYYNIKSSAKNQTGDETRIVEVNRTLSTAPSIMDYVLYSGTGLTK